MKGSAQVKRRCEQITPFLYVTWGSLTKALKALYFSFTFFFTHRCIYVGIRLTKELWMNIFFVRWKISSNFYMFVFFQCYLMYARLEFLCLYSIFNNCWLKAAWAHIYAYFLLLRCSSVILNYSLIL